MTTTRRNFLGAAALLGLAGCGTNGSSKPAAPTTRTPATRTPATSATAGAAPGGASLRPRQPPAGPAGTRLTAKDTTAPLTALRHLMTVPVTLDGHGPYHFAIDSGSAAILHVSAKLGQSLPQIGVVQQGDPSGRNTQTVTLVRVGSLAIGTAGFTGIEAAVGADLGDMHPDGIIGIGLFEQLTATLDYPKKLLRLSRTRLAGGPHTVPFTRPQGTPRIAVRAAGVALQADIDTGGPALLTVPGSTHLPFSAPLASAGTGHTTTGTFDIRAAPLDGDLSVAGWTAHAPTVDVVDALPVTSLGAAYLRDYAVTFDLPAGRLALTR